MRPSRLTTAFMVLALAVPAAAPAAAQQAGGPLSSIFGCDAPGGKQAGGAVVGGVAGALVGSQVSKHERTLGTVVGAALGAAAGSYIGCRMQRGDQQRAELAARDALDRGRDASWSNPDTGASGEVRMVSSGGGPYGDGGYGDRRYAEPATLAGITLSADVEIAEAYEPDGRDYWVRNGARLRASPQQGAPVIGELRAEERIDGLARVRGTDWLLVGRRNVGQGYVRASSLEPAERMPARGSGPTCRTFDQTIRTRDGDPETSRYTACRDPGGEWVIQS